MAAVRVSELPAGSAGASGRRVRAYTLSGGRGMSMTVLDLGATVASVTMPSATACDGEEVTLCDVALGATTDAAPPGTDPAAVHPAAGAYCGVTVGRYANRIAAGVFHLDGVRHALAATFRGQHSHGGVVGWHAAVWRVVDFGVRDSGRQAFVELTHVSPAGDEGYPGTVTAAATYWLSCAGEVGMRFRAVVAGAATPINLCNHCYWNLSGGLTRDVRDHTLRLLADTVVDVDPVTQIPLPAAAALRPVADTAFDFRTSKRVGADLAAVAGGEQEGYDHSFVLAAADGGAPPAAADSELHATAARLTAALTAPLAAAPAPHAAFGGGGGGGGAGGGWMSGFGDSDVPVQVFGGSGSEGRRKLTIAEMLGLVVPEVATHDAAAAGAAAAAAAAPSSPPSPPVLPPPRGPLPLPLRPAAVLCDPASGRRMTVYTTQPAIHLYTANFLRGAPPFDRHRAVCLETQLPPDSPNRPLCGSPTLRPGEVYDHVTVHVFDCAPDTGSTT